jgi:hypothetical protein
MSAATVTRIALRFIPAALIAKNIIMSARRAPILESFLQPQRISNPASISPPTAIQNHVVTERKVIPSASPAPPIIACVSASAPNFITPKTIIAIPKSIRMMPTTLAVVLHFPVIVYKYIIKMIDFIVVKY